MKHALWKNTRKCTKIVTAMTKNRNGYDKNRNRNDKNRNGNDKNRNGNDKKRNMLYGKIHVNVQKSKQ